MKTITLTPTEEDLILQMLRYGYVPANLNHRTLKLYNKITGTPRDQSHDCDCSEERPIGPGPDNYGEGNF